MLRGESRSETTRKEAAEMLEERGATSSPGQRVLRSSRSLHCIVIFLACLPPSRRAVCSLSRRPFRHDGASHERPPNADETRREFIQASVAATAAVALGGNTMAQDKKPGEGIPTRPLGKTGVNVSILCLGGWHIGDVKDKDEAVKIMHAAIDEGMTFFDNCWDYHDGGSEEIMGKALAADGGKWRKKVFLMTKVCARDAQGRPRADRRQPEAAQDRRHRPDADARDQLGQRPRVGRREGRARGAAARCRRRARSGSSASPGTSRRTST